MQANRQHPRPFGAFAVQHVETILEIRVKLIAATETLRRREPHIVRVQGVRHDQERSLDPVR